METKLAYEVLVRTWRPLRVGELIGAIRETFAGTLGPERLAVGDVPNISPNWLLITEQSNT
jgi:hypothetical protein